MKLRPVQESDLVVGNILYLTEEKALVIKEDRLFPNKGAYNYYIQPTGIKIIDIYDDSIIFDGPSNDWFRQTILTYFSIEDVELIPEIINFNRLRIL